MTTRDISPTDEALQSLSETEDAWAEGAAWYGEHGRYSEMRDILLASIGEEIKLALPEGTKVVEAAIERQATAAKKYKEFVERHLDRRIAWLKLDQSRQRLWADYWRLHAEAKSARFAGAA